MKATEKQKEQWNEWYQKNKEKKKAYGRQYQHSHQAEISKTNQEWRKRVIEFLGGKCIVCSFSDIKALQIDHIDGGGYRERRRLKMGSIEFYKHILKLQGEGYQLLCANCNQIKKAEQQEVRAVINMS